MLHFRIFVFLMLFILCNISDIVSAEYIAEYRDECDLEETSQDFFIETKKISIPNYPHAFNPSIVKWKGQWLMSFRVVNSSENLLPVYSASESGIGLIYLDDDFNAIGEAQFVFLDHPNKKRPYLLAEDARLIVKEEHLYMVYSANKEAVIENAGFRVYVAELDTAEDEFFVVHNECLSSFEGVKPSRREKNWTPFVYEDQLLLSYGLSPHKILIPFMDGSEQCDTFASSASSFIWEWGELRGGTPAILLDDDYYLSFFHSSILLKTIHSENQLIPHYFMGMYLFSSEPSFEIKYISPEPIIGPNFYHGLTYEPYWGPVCVVFPCGVVVLEEEIWVTYGRQDHEIWIARLDKRKLLDSLIHVSILNPDCPSGT